MPAEPVLVFNSLAALSFSGLGFFFPIRLLRSAVDGQSPTVEGVDNLSFRGHTIIRLAFSPAYSCAEASPWRQSSYFSSAGSVVELIPREDGRTPASV